MDGYHCCCRRIGDRGGLLAACRRHGLRVWHKVCRPGGVVVLVRGTLILQSKIQSALGAKDGALQFLV